MMKSAHVRKFSTADDIMNDVPKQWSMKNKSEKRASIQRIFVGNFMPIFRKFVSVKKPH